MMLRWLRRFSARDDEPQRWVVLDVETSGFDPAQDGLLSIGGVAMRNDGHILPSDSLELVYRQDLACTRENILVHGIGVQAQSRGADPQQATAAFLDYVATAPILAFHAPFDRGFLARAVKLFVNQPFDNPWLDLAELAPALDPQAKLKTLDEWLAYHGIEIVERHSAAADAFATAQLAAKLVRKAAAQGARSFSAMQKIAGQGRWLSAAH